MTLASLARWAAIAIGVAAVIDPQVPLPRSERPVVRVVSSTGGDVAPVRQALRDAGFALDPASRESATVLVGGDVGGLQSVLRPGQALWALDDSARAPNVSVAHVSAPPIRLPGQAVEIQVELRGRGVTGQTTDVIVEHGGVPVATARHEWADGEQRWRAALHYLPPGAAAATLRVRAAEVPGETRADDNAADVAIAAVRGPLRTLIVEAAVSWPAIFIRRALENDPAFDVSSVQRAAKSVATRSGQPPAALTRNTLSAFEAVVVGGPDTLGAGDLEALRWFVEERGGVAVFVPEQRPSGRYVEMTGAAGFSVRALESPVALGRDLRAAEILIPARLPAAATVAASHNGEPVVFSARRGAGAVVFSGALDAWRQRDDAFGAFWRRLLVASASAVPPAIEVTVEPRIARPGEQVRVGARLRDIPGGNLIAMPAIIARVAAAGTSGKVDESVRLWPTTEPGVYEGEWRARAAGRYDVNVTAGDERGDAAVTVATTALHAFHADPEALALAAAASGGRVFPIDALPSMVEAMTITYPARRVARPSHPMRSAWWLLPFAALLCAEWAVRRRQGLP